MREPIKLENMATSLCVSQDEELIGISLKKGTVEIRHAQNILLSDHILVEL
jgi:uncharacterized protein YwlG (UPF0340 family)